nr:hypothetical protein [Tanacetum cinerariifolium]
IGSAHIPKVNLRKDWWKPLEEERPATPEPAWSILSSDVLVPMNNWASALASNYSPPPEDSLLTQTDDIATFMDWFCKKRGITELKPQDLEGPASEIVKVFHPDVIHLKYQMEECHKLLTDSVNDPILRHNVSKPLPLGGPPGQISFRLMRSANKILLQCMVSLTGGFKDNDSTLIDTHLKVIAGQSGRISGSSAFYESKSSLCMGQFGSSSELGGPTERQEDSYYGRQPMEQTQRVEDFQLGIKSFQTQLNLTKPQWDATGFEYKHDYTVIDSPRAVMFQDKYGVQMMMRFNEIHKYSDGTLQQINEALDYRVKEYRINRMNPGLNTRFWTRKDVDRSKAFMFAIQRRLKTRRIFRNLESFVGG